MTAKQAYEDGLRAFSFRIDRNANPHKAGTKQFFAWQSGWFEAESIAAEQLTRKP